VGRGLTETQLGRALLRAAQSYQGRPYAGSRVLLLVSDGGAALDDETQAALRASLLAQRVALYFLFIRGGKDAPDLAALERVSDATELSGVEAEVLALHRFFRSLATPYRVYQADVPEAIDAAMAEIASQQNLPLTIRQRVPRVEGARSCFAVALGCGVLLFVLAATQRRGWT
jgi:mxaC protein